MYYTLVVLENGRWIPEFGDYDRGVVKDEMRDKKEHGVSGGKLAILCSDDGQPAIDVAVKNHQASYDEHRMLAKAANKMMRGK